MHDEKHAMNCQQFEARLNELLDERAPLEMDDSLNGHIRECAACRELLSAYVDLLQVMRFRSPPAPAPDLAPRIVAAAISQEPVIQETGIRLDTAGASVASRLPAPVADRATAATLRRPVGGGASAASRVWWRAAGIAVAIAVLVAVYLRFQPSAVNNTVSPEGGVAKVAKQDAPAAEPRALSELAQNAAHCYAGLARETRSEFSDVLALVPRVEGAPAAMLLGGEDPIATPEVASHVREGLRPLADSTMAAFTSLFGSPAPASGDL
jgi:hypothetical protein